MKITIKKISVCMLAIVLVFSAQILPALAFEGRHGEGMRAHRAKMMDSMVEKLDLTPKQQSQINQQRESQREEQEKLRIKLQAAMEALKEELGKYDVDRPKVDRLVSEITELRGKMMQERINGILAMKQVLTPEQQDKLKEEIKLKKEKFHKKMNCRSNFARN